MQIWRNKCRMCIGRYSKNNCVCYKNEETEGRLMPWFPAGCSFLKIKRGKVRGLKKGDFFFPLCSLPPLTLPEPRGEALWAPACSVNFCLLSVLCSMYWLEKIHPELRRAITLWEKAAEKISKCVLSLCFKATGQLRCSGIMLEAASYCPVVPFTATWVWRRGTCPVEHRALWVPSDGHNCGSSSPSSSRDLQKSP